MDSSTLVEPTQLAVGSASPVPPPLNPNVELLPPMSADAHWLLRLGTNRSFRITAEFAQVAGALDGTLTIAEIAHQNQCDPAQVHAVVDQLAASNMLGAAPLEDLTPRLRWVRPLTFQLALLKHPSRVLQPLSPVLRSAASPIVRSVVATVVLAGIVALGRGWAEIWAAGAQPLQPNIITGIFLAGIVTTVLHELGHAATLTHHGGEPRRLGVMLFYLVPSFFVDVSDGWRLPRARQRVHVAVAGIVVQLLVGCTAAASTFLIAPGAWRTGVLLFAVSTLAAMLVNFLPFVKLDGYLALMTHLDEPNLRDRAMVDARRSISRMLFGGTYARELPQYRWVPVFGMGCLLFPAVVLLYAWTIWFGSLGTAGAAGTVMVSLAVLLTLIGVFNAGRNIYAEAKIGGVTVPRMLSTLALLIVCILAVTRSIQVPLTVEAGYYTGDSGAVHLVVPATLHDDYITAGMQVELQTHGPVWHDTIGWATIATGTIEPGHGSITATSPVESSIQIDYPRTVTLDVDSDLPATAGSASLHFDAVSLPEWFASRYLSAGFTELF